MSDATTPAPTPAPATPSPQVAAVKNFFRSLLDLKFETFITPKIASVYYVLGLAAIIITALVLFIGTVIGAFAAMQYNPALGILTILGAIVLVPLGTFLAILLFRVAVELTIAVVLIAENTRGLKSTTKK